MVKMKYTGLLIILLLVLSGCSSSRHLQRGNYDTAIEKSVQKLRRNPNNVDEIRVLDQAYNIANEQNLERIRFLERENNPRNTDEIMRLYTRMKNRQTLVRTVLPLQLPDRTIDYQYVDYDEAIIEAKQGAALYYYDNAIRLMELNEKESYRQAFYELQRVDEYIGNYRDTDLLMREAYEKGLSRALVVVENHSHLNLPPDFKNNLLKADPRGLNTEWVEYHFRDLDETVDFDYFLVVNLRMINVSPNETLQKDQMVKKEIEDGFDYLLDENGNVMKDSLGNDIRMPRYKELVCTVIETVQIKEAVIEGDIEIYSEEPRMLVKREPIGAKSLFEHSSGRAVGDVEALDEDLKKIVSVDPLPFPDDIEMVFKTAETLRGSIARAIRSNRRYIR